MKVLLFLLVVAHLCLVAANISSFFILPFLAPWYIAVPVCSYLFYVMFTKVECPLTNLENVMRRYLNLPTINTFVGHYIAKYIYIMLGTRKPGPALYNPPHTWHTVKND